MSTATTADGLIAPVPESIATIEPALPYARNALPFRFEGNGREYFRIWIVNILLSIVTLGVYSAWAKVRNQRYFYGNTYLDNHSFEYRASPLAILRGRLIAVVFLLAYVLGGHFVPWLPLLLMLVFILAFPELICRSMAFRHYNSAYRNIRFGFDGRYGEAFTAFVLWPLLGVLTLGLLYPFAIWRQRNFYVIHSRYGRSYFIPEFGPGAFYRIYLLGGGLILLGVILASIAAGLATNVFGEIAQLVGLPFMLIAILLGSSYISAETHNVVFGQALLQKHGFLSTQTGHRLAWIRLGNALLIVLTLGLGIPWAKVRLARYRAECLQLRVDGSLDNFVSEEARQRSAIGEEVGEAFGLDIGL